MFFRAITATHENSLSSLKDKGHITPLSPIYPVSEALRLVECPVKVEQQRVLSWLFAFVCRLHWCLSLNCLRTFSKKSIKPNLHFISYYSFSKLDSAVRCLDKFGKGNFFLCFILNLFFPFYL